MKTALFTKNIGELKTKALVIGFHENIEEGDYETYDSIADGLISEAVISKEFTGKFGKIISLRLKGDIKNIILIGLGNRDDFNILKAKEIAGKAAFYVREQGIDEFSIVLFDELEPFDASYSAVEGIKLALYRFNFFKTQNLDEFNDIKQFTIVANGNNFIEIDNGIRQALIITDAICYARDLQNNPSNVATPTYLADKAKEISRKCELKCTILDKKHMKKLGMGGVLAVNRGSNHPPKFIIFEYDGGGELTFCFVGKGITFDSGGISIKLSSEMDEMKYDMSGGAVVFGIMQAASRLKIPHQIIGLVPATENLPGGNAYKPGDIIKLYNGKTAEIINTDAEGRLVLGDALAYSKRFNPDFVVDFATLTGACVVSLGSVYSALFSNDDSFSDNLFDAGKKTGENLWKMPMHKNYKDYIKSSIADVKNCGPREAGAITAAMFLKEFVDCKKWAHIDIAGTAWTKNNKEILNPAGGTGFGIKLSLQLMKDLKNK